MLGRLLRNVSMTVRDGGGGDTMNPLSRHIHLSGICGTAMASLAGLLQLQGHRITGSDKAAYPPMSDPAALARHPHP
jgi:hypothetical protein